MFDEPTLNFPTSKILEHFIIGLWKNLSNGMFFGSLRGARLILRNIQSKHFLFHVP